MVDDHNKDGSRLGRKVVLDRVVKWCMMGWRSSERLGEEKVEGYSKYYLGLDGEVVEDFDEYCLRLDREMLEGCGRYCLRLGGEVVED